jgi:uncharacterized protein YbjT (DUF2867 family)
MRDLNEILEQCRRFSTVLVARKSPDDSPDLVEILVGAGVNVLGPVDRAEHALALTAQSSVDFAILTPELAGPQSGRELAQALEETWGVPSYVLPQA